MHSLTKDANLWNSTKSNLKGSINSIQTTLQVDKGLPVNGGMEAMLIDSTSPYWKSIRITSWSENSRSSVFSPQEDRCEGLCHIARELSLPHKISTRSTSCL
jgi:hypothetical protein